MMGYDNHCAANSTAVYMCPYVGGANADTLCSLWELANAAEAASSGMSPSGSGSTIDYNSCPYLNDENGVEACSLWCQIQAASTGATCAGMPVCPYESYTAPDNDVLCQLWSENVWLKDQTSGSGSDSASVPVYIDSSAIILGETVTCPYSEPFKSEKCSLYCENQKTGYNNTCSVTASFVYMCPYVGSANEDVLCDLWEQTNKAEAESSGVSLSGSDLPSVDYNTCPYLDHPNGVEACKLWCQLQAVLYGTVCAGQPVCPYDSYSSPDSSTLCQLWSENVWLKNEASGSGSAISPIYNISSVVATGATVTCPYTAPYQDDKCTLYCENQKLGYDNRCSMSGSLISVCPYLTISNGATLCDLWEQLNAAEASTATSASGSVPYENCPHIRYLFTKALVF